MQAGNECPLLTATCCWSAYKCIFFDKVPAPAGAHAWVAAPFATVPCAAGAGVHPRENVCSCCAGYPCPMCNHDQGCAVSCTVCTCDQHWECHCFCYQVSKQGGHPRTSALSGSSQPRLTYGMTNIGTQPPCPAAQYQLSCRHQHLKRTCQAREQLAWMTCIAAVDVCSCSGNTHPFYWMGAGGTSITMGHQTTPWTSIRSY
jgi:hypothetical protein